MRLCVTVLQYVARCIKCTKKKHLTDKDEQNRKKYLNNLNADKIRETKRRANAKNKTNDGKQATNMCQASPFIYLQQQ